MSGLSWLTIWIVGTGLLAISVSRWPRGVAGIWLVSATLLWVALSLWPPEGLILVLGLPISLYQPLQLGPLTFQVDTYAQVVLRWLALGTATWSLMALVSPVWQENLALLPVAAVTFALAVSAQDIWALGIVWAVWALTVLVVMFAGRPAPARAAWQWGTPFVLAALLQTGLLLWPDPNRAGPEPWRLTLVAVSTILLSGLAPFHLGSVSLASVGAPTAAPFAWLLQPLVVLTVLWRIAAHPELNQATDTVAEMLQLMIPLTLGWVGLRGLVTGEPDLLSGLAATYNWALSLALWVAAPLNPALIGFSLTVRWLSLTALLAGLVLLTDERQSAPGVQLAGAAHQRPWAVATWSLAIASLIGLPFTAGGWLVWSMRFGELPIPGLLWWAFAGAAGLTVGLIRVLLALWSEQRTSLLPPEDPSSKIVTVPTAALVVVLGLWPQGLLLLSRWLY